MWTDTGSTLVNTCGNAYGSGQCLKSEPGSGYAAVKTTISAKPADYSAPTLPWDLADSFGTASVIPIPTIPTSFYPGRAPIKALANGGAAATAAATSTAAKSSAAATSVAAAFKAPKSSYAPSSSATPSSDVPSFQPTPAFQAPPAPQATPSDGLKCKLKRRHFKA